MIYGNYGMLEILKYNHNKNDIYLVLLRLIWFFYFQFIIHMKLEQNCDSQIQYIAFYICIHYE